jgi:SAM-dependent methyltransferase
MAAVSIDALTSHTLKHLRQRWWGAEFTEFLTETLRPRPGNRILDVGCGEGTGEVSIGRMRVSQLELVGVDLRVASVVAARQATASHNQRAGFAAADACHLPFRDAVFDSTYCVAVLQHIQDVDAALAEFARVTAPGGRVVAVEPDNARRYAYSSTPAGMRAFVTSGRFFAALSAARGERTDGSIGPKLPALFARHGLEPLGVRLFPVSHVQLGVPLETVWQERRDHVERLLAQAPDGTVRSLGQEYLDVLEAYAVEAEASGPSFVEIQNTMLFATVAQRSEG